MIKGLYAVLLYVKDVETSLGFYRDKLGFRCAFAEDDFASLSLGNASILLHARDRAKPAPTEVGDTLIHIEVENVDAYCAAITDRGVKVSGQPRDQPWGLRDMYLKDPDGYDLSFVTRIVTKRGTPPQAASE